MSAQLSAGESAVRGLPEPLPVGERLLWQGAPRWQTLTIQALHVRKLAIYFAAVLAWSAWWKLSRGMAPAEAAVSVLELGAVALAPLLGLTLYAWGVARSTTYTVTNRRVVLRFGLVLPMTINLPFSRVDGAAFKALHGGVGDISLTLASGERLAYLLLWPHARPWRMARAEPTLRAVPEASRVAQLLARALAAAAAVPAPVQSAESGRAADRGLPLGAHASAA